MSFLNVYNQLVTMMQVDSTLSAYVNASHYIKGFKGPNPQTSYMLIFEPADDDTQEGTEGTGGLTHAKYEIQVFCRLALMTTKVSSQIVGQGSRKGTLQFSEDVKQSIWKDRTLGYNSKGNSMSSANAGSSFTLDATHRYITVKINDRLPVGYDQIDCGTGVLTGDQVAANIQASLRALGLFADDGYKEATCTFNSSTNRFTIEAPDYGPGSVVLVSAGSANDASSLLGFDAPTEVRGKQILTSKIGKVYAENGAFPVRYRVVPIQITEVIRIGG